MREPMVRFSSPDRMFAMMPGKSLCNLRTRLGEQERPPQRGAPHPGHLSGKSEYAIVVSASPICALRRTCSVSVPPLCDAGRLFGRAHRTSGGAMISVSSRLSRTSAFSSVGQRTHGALSEARSRRAARPRTVAEELRTLRVAGESAPLAAHQVLEVDGAGLPDARIERCAAPARQRGGGARGARRGAGAAHRPPRRS